MWQCMKCRQPVNILTRKHVDPAFDDHETCIVFVEGELLSPNQFVIDRLRERYDPENDIGPEAVVNWADMQLLKVIEDLNNRIEALEKIVQEVE